MPAIEIIGEKVLDASLEKAPGDDGVNRPVSARFSWWVEFAAEATVLDAVAAVEQAAPATYAGMPQSRVAVNAAHSATQYTIDVEYALGGLGTLGGTLAIDCVPGEGDPAGVKLDLVTPAAARAGGVVCWYLDGVYLQDGAPVTPPAGSAGKELRAIYAHPQYSGELQATVTVAAAGGGSGGGGGTQPTPIRYSVSVATETSHVNYANNLTWSDLSDPDPYHGAVNWDGESVKGVDIMVPVSTFAVTKPYPAAVVTLQWVLERRGAIVGKVNANAFLGLARYTVLGTGVTAQWDSAATGTIPVTFNFAWSPNATKAINGWSIPKSGWDYLWTKYRKQVASGMQRPEVESATLSHVYDEVEFAL